MFRLIWALRCFSAKAPIQIALEKSIFLYKFNQAQTLSHFFKEIALQDTSLAQKIFGLKLIIENRHPHSFSPELKIDIVFLIRKICAQTSSFDSISIVEFFNLAMELDKRSDAWYHFKLALNDWKTLKAKIIENINSNLYEKKDFISLFRSWAHFKTKVFEIENNVRKIINDPSIILDLEECIMLLEGLQDLKIKSYLDLSLAVLRRVNQTKEIDPKFAAKILEIVSSFTKLPSFHSEIQQYLFKISSYISFWKREEVLSVIKFYNKGEWNDLIPLETAAIRISSLIRYDEFDMKFLLNLYKELTVNENYYNLFSEVTEKVKAEIMAKIGKEMIDSNILLTLLKLLNYIDEEVAKSLKIQIQSCKWLYFGHKFDVINQISHIFVAKNQDSVPLTDFISVNSLLNEKITNLTRKYTDIKLEILSAILQTRKEIQENLEIWKNSILDELDDIGKSDDKTRKFLIDIAEMKIPENIFPYLRPIYLRILDFCDRQPNKTDSAYILKDSLKLCRSDPAAWVEFYEKNSYVFQYHHIENALKIKDIPYGGLIKTLSPLSLSSSQIRSATSYTFKFSLSSFTPIDATIIVLFPDNSVSFSSLLNHPCFLSRSDNSVPPSAFCWSDFNTHSISVYKFFGDGEAAAGLNAEFSIEFSQICNPKTTEITAAVIIKTLTSSGSLIDQSDSQDFNLTIKASAASMISASILTDSKVIGDSTIWIFSYETLYQSLVGSTIYIEFPSWNGYLNATGSDIKEIIRTSNPLCIGVTNINSAIICSWDSQNRILSVKNGFPSLSTQGAVTFNISSCYNPPRNEALTGFQFYLKSASFWIYESSTNSVNVSVSIPSVIKISNSLTSLTTAWTQRSAVVYIQYYPNIPFSKDDIIEYTIPSEISTASYLYMNDWTGFDAWPTISQVNSNVIRVTKGFPNYSYPSRVYMSFYPVMSPNSTKATGPFTIKHLTSNLYVIAEGTGGAIKVGPAPVTQYSFYPYLTSTSYTTKSIATYYFQFSINKVPTGCWMVVYFPSQIKVASRASSNCKNILYGLDKNSNCFVQNNVLYISDGFPKEYSGQILFGIDRVTNPETNITTSSFNITTYTDNTLAYMIDSIAYGLVFTATYDSSIINVIPQSLYTGVSTPYVFIISTSLPIPAGSQVLISFPANISISSTNACNIILGLSISSNAFTYENSQLLIKNWFQSSKDPGTFSFYLTDVINPYSTKSSGPFTATIYDSSKNVVDFISTGSNIIKMSHPSHLYTLEIDMNDKTNGAIANYTISFTTNSPVPTEFRVKIWSLSSQPACQNMFLFQPVCAVKTNNIASISCQVKNSILIASLTLSNGSLPSESFLSWSILNIKNAISAIYCYFYVSTETADGYEIDYGILTTRTVPADIKNINITAASKEIGINTNYIVSYYPVNSHPSGSYLTINIPSEFSIGEVGCIPITLGPDFSCSATSEVLQTVSGFDSDYDSSTKISFIITNIINPLKNGVASPWVLKSFTPDDEAIDQSLMTTLSFDCSYNCLTCEYSSTNCTSCDENYYLSNFACVDLCPSNYIYDSAARACAQCSNIYLTGYNNTCSEKCQDGNENTCSECLANQYSKIDENECSSACPSCEFCIKCDKECKNCWNYYDFISSYQEYVIICLELKIPKQEFIVGQISNEFMISMNYSCPDISLKSFNDEIAFNGEKTSNFKILINESYDIINNPPYFWAEIGGIPLNISIDPKYDDFSLFIMNNENLIQQSYEQFGRVLINLLGGIIFHRSLYPSSIYSCQSILSDITITEMGGNSIKCYIQNESTLIIIMDQWAAATNSLVFKNYVFSKKNQPDITNLKLINLEIRNFNPSPPIPIINSISRICCGCNFTLDGSLSTGIGLLNYKWFIDDVFLSIETVTYAVARGCGLKSEIRLKLEISDLWYTETAQKSIKLEQVPSILVIKYYDDIVTHKYATFSADVYWDMATQSSATFNIEWNYWPENDKTRAVTIKGQKEFSTVFYDEVNYTISATAIPNNVDFASDNETIFIIPAPDIPTLSIVGVNSSIYWAAQISFYVDLVYSDGYKDRKYPMILSEINCPYGVLVSGSRNGDFSFLGRENENYWCSFTVNVTFSPKMSKSIPCYFNVSKSKVPEVYVSFYWEYFDYSAPTRFMANIPDQTDLIITWVKTDSNPEINISTPTSQSSYTIDAFTLIPGLTYEFKIIARNNITNATTEVVTRRPVNSPPQGGSFFVTPNSGYSLDTGFLAIFSGWVDPEHNMPLSYQIFQQNDKEAVAITPKMFSNVFAFSIGSVGNILLIGRIYDGLGTFRNLTFQINVKAIKKDSKSEADQLITAGLNIDQAMYISKIVAISMHTFENYIDENYIQNVLNTLVDALNLWTFSRNISSNDVSASVDIVSVLLNQSNTYNENLIQNITWTLENVLSQTSKLDFGTYSVFLKQIDLLSSRTYQLNSLKSNSFNQLSFFEKFDKSFNEASVKYQITTNPNEYSINYNGEFYNSTIVSKDKRTLNNPVSLDKVGLTANFYVDTSQDNDNTIYHQSLISLNSIGNITNSLLLNTSAYSTTIGSCSFNRDSQDAYIESSDFIIHQNYKYPLRINSTFIKPNITKTISDLDNRNYEQVNATNIVLAISPSLLNSAWDYSCQILDQSSNLFSTAQCKTKLNPDHSYTCECEFLNLVSLIPAPDVYPVIKNLYGKIELEIYEGFSWITFAVFSLLTVVYLVLLRDLIRIDKFTHKFLKRKVRAIIAKIKNSIKNIINLYETRENIDLNFEKVKRSIENDVLKLLSDKKEKKFLPNLLTKKRIMKQANDCFIERDLSTIINCIEIMDLDLNFKSIKNRLIAKKGYIRKINHFLIKIFRIQDQDKMLFGEIIKEKARSLRITIDFTEELIEKLLEHLQKPLILIELPMKIEKKESKADKGDTFQLDLESPEYDVGEEKIKAQVKARWNEDRVEHLTPYEIPANSKYKSNWYLIFLSYLQRNIHNNFEPEISFTYYFLKDNLVLGLIGFTNLNFSRKGRLTLLMVSLFINIWVTILLFGSKYRFDNQKIYYGVSKLHVILYTLSFAIGLIVSIIAIFLPSNYLKEEFLAKNVFKSVTSRIFYWISWIVMIMLFYTGCTTASKLDLYEQVTLTKEIFMNLFFAISSEAFVKPIVWWCYKWFKYTKLSPIMGVVIRRLNCFKNSSKGLHDRKTLPEADKF